MANRWTITRAEYDGWVAKIPSGRWSIVAQTIANLALAGLIVGLVVAFSQTVWLLVVVGAILGSNTVSMVRSARRMRRTRELAARLWDLDGAACPLCLEPLERTACRDGLTTEDSDAVRAGWEASIRGDVAGATSSLRALSARSRRPGFVGMLRSLRLGASQGVFDPTQALWKRLAFAILSFGVPMGLFFSAFGWASTGRPPSVLEFVLKVQMFGLMWGGGMITVVAWKGVRAGRNHCAACAHLIADGHETRPCTECGADLGKPGAVVSGETSRDPRTATVGIAICVAALMAPLAIGTDMLASVLPTRMLFAQYRIGDPSVRFGIVRELSTRKLDAATTAEFADLLIESAQSTPDASLDDSSFVGNALLAGTIDEDTVRRALRATVAVDLEVPARVRAGEPFFVRVKPRFGSELFQLTHFVCVAWSGVEADGGVFATTPRFYTAYEMRRAATGDASAQPPAIRLEFASPGTRTLRVRAFAVPLPMAPLATPSFDQDGVLQAPEGAVGLTEIDAEATVVVE
jgi:hypothetical protein